MVLAPLTRRQLISLAKPALHRPTRSVSSVPVPPIRPRSAWADDRPALAALADEDVRFLIVHHSASNNGHSSADAPRILRGFYDFHTSPSRGWDDIAYNFLIDSEGGIWEGRKGSLEGPVAGDAMGGNQGFTQLVCLIGDFDQRPPTSAALGSLVGMLAWLADRYDISTSPGSEVVITSRGSNRHPAGSEVTTPTITGHRAMSQTSCPGDHLNDYVVSGLMADVEGARVAAATTSTPIPVPTTTSTTTTSTTTTLASTMSTTSPRPATASTTAPVAAEPTDLSGSGWVGAIGAVLVTVGGLLWWRHRRMTR